jgi:hypothetical protein
METARWSKAGPARLVGEERQEMVGLIGSNLVFVPRADAVVSPKDVHADVDKKLAKDAPSIETDGQLESAMESAVFEHYGFVYSQGASGERRLGRR